MPALCFCLWARAGGKAWARMGRGWHGPVWAQHGKGGGAGASMGRGEARASQDQQPGWGPANNSSHVRVQLRLCLLWALSRSQLRAHGQHAPRRCRLLLQQREHGEGHRGRILLAPRCRRGLLCRVDHGLGCRINDQVSFRIQKAQADAALPTWSRQKESSLENVGCLGQRRRFSCACCCPPAACWPPSARWLKRETE